MKKLLFYALVASAAFANDLENYLSNDYNELFSLQQLKSKEDAAFESKSWVAPITLGFARSWNNQIAGGWHPYNSYTIGIEQPIFKSGGIYYGIKYAKSHYDLSVANILKQKASLKASAIELALKIKQAKYAIAKLKLQLKNRDIEIATFKELYGAGLATSVDLDNALVRKDEANMALFDLQSQLAQLKSALAKISDQNAKDIKAANLVIPTMQEYVQNNIDIAVAKAKSKVAHNLYKMTRSKYLPTVTVGARYTKLSQVQAPRKDAFTNYSLRISMPISVNISSDLERNKLESMLSRIDIKNTLRAAKAEYKAVRQKISAIDKKIALAKREVRTYSRVLKSTQALFKAGEKSKQDVLLLKNSKRVKQLDIKIFKIERKLAILELYKKVK